MTNRYQHKLGAAFFVSLLASAIVLGEDARDCNPLLIGAGSSAFGLVPLAKQTRIPSKWTLFEIRVGWLDGELQELLAYDGRTRELSLYGHPNKGKPSILGQTTLSKEDEHSLINALFAAIEWRPVLLVEGQISLRQQGQRIWFVEYESPLHDVVSMKFVEGIPVERGGRDCKRLREIVNELTARARRRSEGCARAEP